MKRALLLPLAVLFTVGLLSAQSQGEKNEKQAKEAVMDRSQTTEFATLGGGCFWCMEAVYERIEGVLAVVSGYAAGNTANPTYQEVCTGETGHAEVIQIEYDPALISYEQILKLFWKVHDPCTLNRQGADSGTQYRSIILYHTQAQREAAQESLNKQLPFFEQPIVTQIVPLTEFYPAEDYHQDYYDKNPYAGYCQLVITPKLHKLELE